MSEERTQVNFTVDENAKELAKQKLDHGEFSERLRSAVEEIAFGEELSRRSQLEARLEKLRDREGELETERDSIESELSEVRDKIGRVEDRLDDLQTLADEYEIALQMLEDQLMDGTHIDPEHGQVKKAAHIGECEPIDVINDLQERNPSVPDYAFEQQWRAADEWNGVADEKEGEV